MRVLLVDDDARVLVALKRLLVASGHTVWTAESPAAALLVLAEQPSLDGALLDVNLGVEDGVALGARLHQAAPGLPIAFMTGSPESALRAAAHGVVLEKPCGADTLRALVRSWPTR